MSEPTFNMPLPIGVNLAGKDINTDYVLTRDELGEELSEKYLPKDKENISIFDAIVNYYNDFIEQPDITKEDEKAYQTLKKMDIQDTVVEYYKLRKSKPPKLLSPLELYEINNTINNQTKFPEVII